MTLTEPTEMTTKRLRTAPMTYTSSEVLEMTGLSFRVLDYWLRTGAIKIAGGTTPGSGVSRQYSEDEVAAIQRLAERYQKANAEIEAIRSGKAWAALVGAEKVVA